ncbi:MAG: hypothetical protein ABI421_05630 [Polyangiaceae bacterium]
MLITCKACAAVNFIQSKLVKRGEAHCTICRKLIDISATGDSEQPSAFRSKEPPPLPASSSHDLFGELEQKLENMNSKQRLAIASTYQSDSADVIIEDEEEEELDMTPSLKLPPMDLSRWNAATVPSIPASGARSRLNQRLTVAAWMFVVGLGTVGVAGAAVAHASTTSETEKKNGPAPTATALLASTAQHASANLGSKAR